jgi:hypothetical protein
MDLNLKYEFTYTIIERGGESWSGVYAGRQSAKGKGNTKGDQQHAKHGAAQPGKMRGGTIVAHNEQEALDQIKELHSEQTMVFSPEHPEGVKGKRYLDFELVDLSKRGVVL